MKVTLAVVGFPIISPQDAAWIDDVRVKYPELHYAPIPPHFTFVFPTSSVDHDELTRHIEVICRESNARPISFAVRCCLLVKDGLSPQTHIFLTPDEGLSQIGRLHDRLYTGILQPDLRLDIPYIPHITLGHTADAQYGKQIVDELNQTNFEIRGKIEALSVLAVTDGRIESLVTIPLNP